MVFEDSLAGIEAAWRAGMKPVMVPDKVPADSVTEERLYAKLKTLDEGIGLLKKKAESRVRVAPCPQLFYEYFSI